MKRTTVSLNEGERFGLRSLSRKLGLSLSAVVRRAIDIYLRKPRVRSVPSIGNGSLSRVTIVLNDDQADRLRKIAGERGTALVAIVRDAIVAHLLQYKISIRLRDRSRQD